jgi:hypothetical protein
MIAATVRCAERHGTAYTVTTVPSSDDQRVSPGRLAFGVFAAVVTLIAIVFAVQFIPDAKRPTIQQPPSTTTIIVPAPSSP